MTTRRLAPAHWEAELANVLWQAVRAGVLPAGEARSRLKLAFRLRIETVPTSAIAAAALVGSISTGITVYDTLFVELARGEQCPLLTFDQALLRKFPEIAASPESLAPRD
jgi:predicted nucleic acid-binding protein